MDAHTGSTTSGMEPSRPMPTSVHTCATASMIAVDASMPVLAAETPMSSTTQRTCAATVSRGLEPVHVGSDP